MAYEILGRRADGRGTVRLDRWVPSRQAAINCARAKFAADHSLTMVWVLEPGANQTEELFTRDLPGADPHA